MTTPRRPRIDAAGGVVEPGDEGVTFGGPNLFGVARPPRRRPVPRRADGESPAAILRSLPATIDELERRLGHE